MAIEITRLEGNSEGLRKLARRSTDGYKASRIFAIADILEGLSREESAKRNGMSRQTLSDWVHRYNEEGIEGLKNRKRGGRPALINPEVQEHLKEVLVAGPDPEKDAVIRWRIVDLQAWLKHEHRVECGQEAVRRMVHKLGFRKMTARPQHPKQSPEVIEAFKETL